MRYTHRLHGAQVVPARSLLRIDETEHSTRCVCHVTTTTTMTFRNTNRHLIQAYRRVLLDRAPKPSLSRISRDHSTNIVGYGMVPES